MRLAGCPGGAEHTLESVIPGSSSSGIALSIHTFLTKFMYSKLTAFNNMIYPQLATQSRLCLAGLAGSKTATFSLPLSHLWTQVWFYLSSNCL